MKNQWTTWMLAGGLLASLQWNLRSEPPPQAPTACAVSTGEAERCELDPSSLGLSDEQTEQLTRLCETECRLASDHERRASDGLRELKQMLASTLHDEDELRALVREISKFREQSLMACVDSILQVRQVLDEEQLTRLLETCYRVDGATASAPACRISPCSTE